MEIKVSVPTLEDKASRPRPRQDLVEAKATILCPRGVLEVEDTSRTPSLLETHTGR